MAGFEQGKAIGSALALSLAAFSFGAKSSEAKLLDPGLLDAVPVSEPAEQATRELEVKSAAVRLDTWLGTGSGILIKDAETGAVCILTARHVLTNRQEHLGTLIRNQEILDAGGTLPKIKDSAEISLHEEDGNLKVDFTAKPRALELEPDALNKLLQEMHFAMSSLYDVALLEFKEKIDLPTVPLRDLEKEPLKVGEKVHITCQSDEKPFQTKEGTIEALSVTEGVHLVVKHIQIDMPVNPGDSGSGLLDSQGRLIGIVTKEHSEDKTIGYAVPLSEFAETLSKQWGFNLYNKPAKATLTKEAGERELETKD